MSPKHEHEPQSGRDTRLIELIRVIVNSYDSTQLLMDDKWKEVQESVKDDLMPHIVQASTAVPNNVQCTVHTHTVQVGYTAHL